MVTTAAVCCWLETIKKRRRRGGDVFQGPSFPFAFAVANNYLAAAASTVYLFPSFQLRQPTLGPFGGPSALLTCTLHGFFFILVAPRLASSFYAAPHIDAVTNLTLHFLFIYCDFGKKKRGEPFHICITISCMRKKGEKYRKA